VCGIAGVFNYRAAGAVDGALLDAMLSAIAHRGPDDRGVLLEDAVGIGNNRLSIIDLEGGRQPFSSEDASVAAVYNGEIYNYRALANELRVGGHQLRSAGDGEPIVHLYEDHGTDFVQHLRGMFSIAVWDRRRRRLVLARDRLGIKPLYYSDNDGRLAFASEIKALLPVERGTPRVDLDGLAEFLGLKYVPAPRTMFDGIRALPPGHLLICDDDGVRVRRYWDLSFAKREGAPRAEDECTEQLAALLRESVGLHLVSDVPFGAFLSGGVDSSTIVALMSEVLAQPVRTFSVGYDGADERFSELPYARMVADRYETDHHEVIIRSADFVNRLRDVIWHLDQPIADEACLPNAMVSDLASQHVKMVLTGEGGDELFAGYARYAGERWASPVRRVLPGPMRTLALQSARRLPGLRRPKLALYAACQPEEARRFASWFPLFNEDVLAELKSERFSRMTETVSAHAAFAPHLLATDAADPLSRMLYVDTKLWLPDDLLARGDKTSMASSIEARLPLLDHVLVEFAASLPPSMKLRGRTRKYLLRQVARDLLPPPILSRKKQGFPTPVSSWFRGPARDFLRDQLSPGTVRSRGLFDVEVVGRLLDEHDSGHADHGSLLFGLLSVELWHQLYIDSPALTVVS
jgi:asparagine synthase (glutamine-hydrolysing)